MPLHERSTISYPENIAARLSFWAKKLPEQTAVSTDKSSLSFFELEECSKKFAAQLIKMDIPSGSKVLLFVRPGLYFSALIFALFRSGLVPVFIDPGMKKKYLFKSIREIKPEVLIAEPKVHLLRLFKPGVFKSIRFFLRPKDLATTTFSSFQDKRTSNPAAILFTSGATGRPKGVIYTHRMFASQVDQLRDAFDLKSGQVDVAGFALFGLFSLANGMNSKIPAVDQMRPAKVCPVKLYQNIERGKASLLTGSPVIWDRLAEYCHKKNLKLSSVKHLVMFGAPVSLNLHRRLKAILPSGSTYSAYGATECLPVAVVSGDSILNGPHLLMRQGKGAFLGRPLPGVRVAIIPITDGEISHIDSNDFLPPEKLGEIIVCSPCATPGYIGLDLETSLSKMKDENGNIWHRMGDLGLLDDDNQLWFAGRKSHLIKWQGKILSSVQCEAVFNQHPEVKRSALIGLVEGAQKRPAIVIERKDRRILRGKKRRQFDRELLDLGQQKDHTLSIENFFHHPNLPVDTRHNIKIDRLKLALWANKRKLT